MATCSYQALSRYDDDCSRKYRARNLDDIRVTHRQALARVRLQLKCLKMLQNRQTLVDVLFADDDADYYVSGYEELDAAADTTLTDSNPWYSPSSETTSTTDCCPHWPEDEASNSSVWSSTSASDSGSTYHHQHQVTSLSDLPESFLEDISSGSPHPNARQQRRKRHSATYKQAGTHSLSSSSSRSVCDSEKTRQEFENLMNLIKQCPPTAQNVSHLIGNSCQTILNAIQLPSTLNDGTERQVGSAAIELLISTCTRNLMTPGTLVSLLQHGLHYSLCNAIYSLKEGTTKVCDLLILMISTEPGIIPYLVEVMMNSKLASELNERIICGAEEDAQAVMNFYQQLTETIISHRGMPLTPLIPQILLDTGVSQHTLQSYGPDSTLQKYLTPELTKSIVSRCLNRTYTKYSSNLNLPLGILANILKLAYTSEDEQWVVRTLCCLRDLKIGDKMNTIIKGLNRLARLADSSEHCSQGVSLGQATESAQVCNQFLQFYEQYYNYLAQGFAAQLMANDHDNEGGFEQSECSSIATDSWSLDD